MEIVTSWMEEGLQKGQRVLVLRQLRKRLGSLDERAESRIEALSTERLEELGEALLDFSSPDDLAVWSAGALGVRIRTAVTVSGLSAGQMATTKIRPIADTCRRSLKADD